MPIQKPDDRKFVLGGYAALALGVACAGEAAAFAISAASGSHLGHPLFGYVYNPLQGLRWLGALDGNCVVQPYIAHLKHHAVRTCATRSAAIARVNWSSAYWLGGGVALFGGSQLMAAQARNAKPGGRRLTNLKRSNENLVIRLGRSTGTLYENGAQSGIKRGQDVCLANDDLHLDTFIVGGKGAGKTTRALNPMLLQAMQQGCGGIIFNVKGNYDDVIRVLAERADCVDRLRVVGVGGEHCDILNDVTPEMAQTYVSAILLLSDTGKDSMIWNTSASLLVRAILTLLWYFPSSYSLPNCYRYIYVTDIREQYNARVDDLQAQIKTELEVTTDDAIRGMMQRDFDRIEFAKREIANYYDQTPEIQRGIKLQLQSILSNMIVPEMEDAFSNLHPQYGQAPFELTDTYEKGTIFVINAPTQEYGVAAAAAAAWIKLRFQATMDQRRIRRGANQTNRVFMAIDEVQEIVTASKEGLSDHKFLATSRDTGTFVIVATQSIHALDVKIGVEMRKALMPNFRQRLCFQSDDIDTIEMFTKLLGPTDVKRETKTTTRGRNSSRGTAVQEIRQPIAQEDLFRNLDANQAVFLGNIAGRAADDVIQMTPVYT